MARLEVKSCVDAPSASLLACAPGLGTFSMRRSRVHSIVWVVVFAVIALLAVTTGSAVAHELQHAAHHDAGMMLSKVINERRHERARQAGARQPAIAADGHGLLAGGHRLGRP